MRVYYWFKGVPKDRAGSPWWAQDFRTDQEAVAFIKENRPLWSLMQLTQRTEVLILPQST